MIWFWLGLLVLAICVGVAAKKPVCIFFALGALMGACVAYYNDLFFAQLGLAFFSAAVFWLVFGVYHTKSEEKLLAQRSSLDGAIGQIGIVTERIDNAGQTGSVKVHGVVRPAISRSGEQLKKNAIVRVTGRKGFWLVVAAADTGVDTPHS